jgi:hypothetical protein
VFERKVGGGRDSGRVASQEFCYILPFRPEAGEQGNIHINRQPGLSPPLKRKPADKTEVPGTADEEFLHFRSCTDQGLHCFIFLNQRCCSTRPDVGLGGLFFNADRKESSSASAVAEMSAEHISCIRIRFNSGAAFSHLFTHFLNCVMDIPLLYFLSATRKNAFS